MLAGGRIELCRPWLRRTRCTRLLAALIFVYWWLPAAAIADELARIHDREVDEMVAASVKMETGFNAIFDDFSKRKKLEPDASSSALRAEGFLNQECYNFVHARFFARYRTLLNGIDTSGIASIANLRRDRTDRSVLRDPQKIAYETNYIISSFKFMKDFHPPLEEFVVGYAARPNLQTKCARYLDATGMRN